MRLVIRNATVVTVDANNTEIPNADIEIVDDRIAAISTEPLDVSDDDTDVIDASGLIAIPGFVQPHIHLCQTLYRNHADDLVLIDWLRTRIWPMEAAHTPETLRAAADLGLAELIRSGTTTILDMGTVNHTDAIGEAVKDAGTRAYIGKCMMDLGEEVPAAMLEKTSDSLRESEALCKRWHGAADGRIGYAFAPRFALSCTTELLEGVGELADELGVFIHTHSSETQFEIEETTRLYGKRNVDYLAECGITGERSVLAHGVWLDDSEVELLATSRTAIAHCPSSNLKLASGIANIPRLLDAGVKVGIAADGAPCNNTLNQFTEMRHAALIQKPIHGPTAMPAPLVLRLATMGGAEALGMADEVGSLEVGKKADIALLRLHRPHNGVGGSLAARIVYSSYPENVDTVICNGRVLMERGELLTLDEEKVMATARKSLHTLAELIDAA